MSRPEPLELEVPALAIGVLDAPGWEPADGGAAEMGWDGAGVSTLAAAELTDCRFMVGQFPKSSSEIPSTDTRKSKPGKVLG